MDSIVPIDLLPKREVFSKKQLKAYEAKYQSINLLTPKKQKRVKSKEPDILIEVSSDESFKANILLPQKPPEAVGDRSNQTDLRASQ